MYCKFVVCVLFGLCFILSCYSKGYLNLYYNYTENSIWRVGRINIYKISKIIRALWLAERSVCMRVWKHGCDVRCFAFRALITQARIWKSFSDQNSTSLLLFTNSFVGWNLENLYKQAVSTFFRLSWHFKVIPMKSSTIKLCLKLGIINIHDMNIKKMQ